MVVIYIIATIAILQSALSLWLISVIIMICVACLIPTLRTRLPYPAYTQLVYRAKQWLLHSRSGQSTQFEQASIRFDGGIFLLVNLLAPTQSKTLVIFKDQMTREESRELRLMIKLTQNANHE